MNIIQIRNATILLENRRFSICSLSVALLVAQLVASASGQTALEVESPGFEGVLHDNLSNKQRQGSGFTPLILKSYSASNLFRDDAVGLNFEHIFNGAEKQKVISMFTPRSDPCHVKQLGESRYQIQWPAEASQWGIEARMNYDLSKTGQIDLDFECTPTRDLFPQGFVAMMWASYLNRTLDRTIHFWGEQGDRTGWVRFGVGKSEDFEVGTVSHAGVSDLPYEPGAQTLNLIEHPEKKFITPFYYGLIDGDHDLTTTDDRLLFLLLFDQTDSIRFAMWNFIQDDAGVPDKHSPAWDWQYVIRDPQVGRRYGYRARVVVKPFKGKTQIWKEYQKWSEDLELELPPAPMQE